MILKNVTGGPKVVNTLAGPVSIPGGSEAEVEISKEELASAKATDWFEEVEPAKGKAPAKSAKE